MATPGKLMGIGLTGTVVAALCCFTPILVVSLSAIGLAAVIGYLDYVLLPALAFFIGLTAYALWRYSSERSASHDPSGGR